LAPYSEAIIWDAIIPSAIEPWHPNTYIHPGTTKNVQRARKDPRKKSGSKDRKRTTDDDPKPYPHGATEGILRLSNQKPKYQITTPTSRIAGLSNCTLHLRYNVQPWVGALQWSAWPASKDGVGRQKQQEGTTSLLTPFWASLRGESSAVFEMPELKAKVDPSRSREELGTETGAEAHRLMAG